MIRFFVISVFIAIWSVSVAREVKQIFKCSGEIVSSPVVTDHFIIVTSTDSICRALHKADFSVAWQYKSGQPLRSSALVTDGRVYLETGNKLTCLNLKTGAFLWKSPNNACSRINDTDAWDYFRAQPEAFGGTIYLGDDFGWFNGTDSLGNRSFEFHTGNFASLHAGISVIDSVAYFGNYAGTLFAYSLSADSLLYAFKSIDDVPYENFGAILSKPVANDQVMVWGSRNSTLIGFDYKRNLVRWKYTDPSEAWMSGTPVVYKDLLYIGSSDSKSLFCFEVNSGNMKWQTKLDQNVFAAPLVTKKDVIVCDGNAYDDGYGIIYFLAPKDGKIKERLPVKGNIVSAPVLLEKGFIVGARNGSLYLIQ